MMISTKEIAQQRIEQGLSRLDKAQVLLREASRDLCPVVGFDHEWMRASDLSDDVRKVWLAVANRRHHQHVDISPQVCDLFIESEGSK